jgi:uncharacterized membrane protein YphA (DoxX/SURF4 family)
VEARRQEPILSQRQNVRSQKISSGVAISFRERRFVRNSSTFFLSRGAIRIYDSHDSIRATRLETKGVVFKQMKDYSSIFLRLALGISFLAAVADRFGLWGSFGQPNVAWGDFSHFVAYTWKLNWFMPPAAIPVLAWAATCVEILLGIALVVGAFTRVAAFLSGWLLLLFALSMTFALGLKAPRNFSVFTASAASFLLATCRKYSWSLDSLRKQPERNP